MFGALTIFDCDLFDQAQAAEHVGNVVQPAYFRCRQTHTQQQTHTHAATDTHTGSNTQTHTQQQTNTHAATGTHTRMHTRTHAHTHARAQGPEDGEQEDSRT